MATAAPDLQALRQLGDRVRPLALGAERLVTVPETLAALLPQGGLPRGSTIATGGVAAASLALALAAPTTASGSWIAVVGLAQLGLLAGAELGVDLERVLLVADPGSQAWPAAVAALLDAVDLVLVRPGRPITPTVQRRLQARARDRGSVLVQVGGLTSHWAQAPDLVLRGSDPAWVGLGPGHGRLQARQLTVTAEGRRGAGRPRSERLWLPDEQGRLAPVVASRRDAPRATASPVGSPVTSVSPVSSPVGVGPLRDAG